MISSRKHKTLYLFFVLPVLALISGCAMLGLGGDPAGYGAGDLSYQGVDFTVLQGRTIVLDPGHGGRYSGAVGKKGLTEKEVNLSVAKVLRDLLVSYGATVVMTRDEDADLLPEGAEGPVRADLRSRVDSADAAPDAVCFLSIHHNDLGVPDPRYNAIETYYKMGDTGPSLDLARYIHRHLNRAVGLPRQALRPGNIVHRHQFLFHERCYLSLIFDLYFPPDADGHAVGVRRLGRGSDGGGERDSGSQRYGLLRRRSAGGRCHTC